MWLLQGGPDFPVNQTLSNIYGRKSASPEAPDHVDETQVRKIVNNVVSELIFDLFLFLTCVCWKNNVASKNVAEGY